MALGYIAYGNEPSLGAVCSYAALIADIPPFLELLFWRELCRVFPDLERSVVAFFFYIGHPAAWLQLLLTDCCIISSL
jgi:hypothetical protein